MTEKKFHNSDAVYEGLSLGELIKKELNTNAFNVSAIARKMNVSKQSLNTIDKRKHFDLGILIDLKKATGLDFTDFYKEYKPAKVLSNIAGFRSSIIALKEDMAKGISKVEIYRRLCQIEVDHDEYLGS